MPQSTPTVVIGAATMGALLGVGLAHADGPAQLDHHMGVQPSPSQVVLSEPLPQSGSVNHHRGAEPVDQLHSFKLPSTGSVSNQMPSPLLIPFGDRTRDATRYHGRHRREDQVHAADAPIPPPRRSRRVHTAQHGGMSGGGMMSQKGLVSGLACPVLHALKL